MQRDILKKITLIVLLGTSTFATAASFDCRRASTDIETVICDDPVLSDLDSEMGRLYHKAKHIAGMKNEQKGWIHHRNSLCGSSDGCLIGETKNRIFVLKKALKNSGSRSHQTANVYSPDDGIICDKKSQFCADSQGISLGWTKEYLGARAAKVWTKRITRNFDTTVFTMSNGLYCDTNEKICKKSKWDDRPNSHWTRIMFGY